MTERMPALALVAVPGRRDRTIELNGNRQRWLLGHLLSELWRRNELVPFVAHVTEHVQIGTAIHPIYLCSILMPWPQRRPTSTRSPMAAFDSA
ncbi:MAG: hypothetical protein R2706_02150 [Acidimicrobiales bacterium]